MSVYLHRYMSTKKNKVEKVAITSFCQCNMCKEFFEVHGKRSKFCSRKCRDRASYINKKKI